MDKYGALLHMRWQKSTKGSDIIDGHWAEDNSTYSITCPEQLRDLLVAMQNDLSDQYVALEDARRKVKGLERIAGFYFKG